MIGLVHMESITKLLTCHGAIANGWYEIQEQVEKEMKSILFMCRSKMNSARAKNEDT